jgi:hypothetical protein
LAEKKRSKSERELMSEHNVFLQLMTRKDYDGFVGGLVRELQLRRRIEELKSYRLNGARTFQEADYWESERRRRDPRFRDGPSSSFSSAAAGSRALGPRLQEVRSGLSGRADLSGVTE